MTSERFGAACGLLVAVMFVAGAALLDLPGHDDDDRRLTAFYSDGGNRLRVILGSYCLAISGMALLGLGAVLSVRAERAGASLVLTRVMLLACAVAAVLLMGTGAAQAPTYAISIDAFDEPESELTRATIPHIGYSLLLFGMLAAAALAGATAAAIRATGMLPRWAMWFGFVTAGLLPLSIAFTPLVAFPIWAAAMGVALWRCRPAEPARASA